MGTAGVIAGSGSWITLHLIIILGILLMLYGLFALYRTISGALPQALAQFGMLTAVTGVTIATPLVVMDGVGARQLAEDWSQATPDQAASALLSPTSTVPGGRLADGAPRRFFARSAAP